MGWTPAQEQAIHTPTGNGNLLVSAAAGSGKTAVLVERILQKLINKETTVDRLLVVTFTNAAAAEMREKIIKQLIKEVGNPDNDAQTQNMLNSQIRLAETADIMTIDAFCNRIVQNNFHVMGTDPNVTVADTAMCDLLRAEAIDNLFDRLYTTKDEDEALRFSRLLDAYSDNRSDTGLIEAILEIHKFVVSFADPKKWLDAAAEAYTLPAEQMPYTIYLKEITKEAAVLCINSINLFLEENKDISEFLKAYATELAEKANIIVRSDDWTDMYEIYRTYFKRLSTKKQPDSIIQKLPVAETKEEKKLANKLAYIRTVFADRLSMGITFSLDEFEDELCSEHLHDEAYDIVWIVKEFMGEYAKIKENRGVCEFSDIEQLTYMLFRDNEDIRELYKNKYDEILIDEYQDTNELQDSIFRLISHDNIFMVGDLKQSIYRFRGGDPYIFKKKRDTYGSTDPGNIKITLAQNFRSRQEVLSSVNDMFSSIMSRDVGDVEYVGDELIIRDAEREYYPPPSFDCKSELHYIAASENADKNKEEIRFVVDKICELLTSGILVYDKETGMRPIRKKDIVILENSVKSNGELIVAELAKRGIDAFAETESFFSRREILTMLSLLSILSNIRQDIPLLSVMRSPIGGFSEDELVRIRLFSGKCDNFITAVRSFARSGGRYLSQGTYNYKSGNIRLTVKHKRSALTNKCRKFLADIHRWRGYVRTKSVAQLIWTLFEETYFYDIMGAIEQGEEAQFNLRLFYERAKQFESAGFKGLFNFIRYIENIESHSEDLGGAKLVGENHDVVRVMTIHKSKGLEFPVVFMIGAGKSFRSKSSSTNIRYHKILGLGLPYIHYDRHYMRDTKLKNYIFEVNKRELTSERIRLAYVALTRAREKLYVVVSQNVKEDFSIEDHRHMLEEMMIDGELLPSVAAKAAGFYSWLCPAAYANPQSWKFIYHTINTTEDDEPEEISESEETYEDSKELRDAVYEILNYRYPFVYSNTIPSRTSVTQLKELTIERENIYDAPVHEPDSRRVSADDMAELMFSPLHPKPAFMRDDGDKPANEIGTLYHLVMSEIDLERIKKEGSDCIENELQRLLENEIISDEDMKYLNCDKIKNFYSNEIGKRLLKSREVHREEPFQINISALDYDPALTSEYADETVILQGIIDCFFYEKDGYVLVDYKTDKVRNNSIEIRKKYDKQLELYKKAIEKLTGIKVKETLLYLFDTDETV